MIYDAAAFRPLGDMGLLVEYGDEVDLRLSFRVTALTEAVKEARIGGVLDYVVSVRSLGILFDAATISYARLVDEVSAIDDSLSATGGTLHSRLCVLPIWYDDPWSAEAAERNGVPKNIELVAQHSGVTVPELIAMHCATDHWVGAVGANPGTCIAYPLDAAYRITAPKYETPRTSTPVGCLAVAGRETAPYPVDSAGGFQLIGHAPFDWWDPQQRGAAFRDSPALARVGDRHRYVPIDGDEHARIRELVDADAYEFDIREEVFDVDAWLREQNARDETTA